MAEIDRILSELRHRIMGPFESGPPKPATQEVDSPVKHSAVVAMLRLAHPGRDDGAVVGDDPVSEPINPEGSAGAVVGDELNGLFKRLSRDMPKLMEEVVAFIERRTAELNGDDGAASSPRESVAPAAAVSTTPAPQDAAASKSAITLLFDTQVLTRIDADAKRVGISRTAWLHVAADERLEGRR
jgi:hypothetical protein